MIVDSILDWIFTAIEWMLNIFDNIGLPYLGMAVDGLGFMNYFLPVSELTGIFIAFFALGVPMGVATIATWLVVGVIRGGSSRA